MSELQQLETELKHLIVDTLMLEEVTPEEIETEAALFGEGLGLDSIDALELGMAISKKYQIKLKDEQDGSNRSYFESVKTLAAMVDQKRKEVAP